MNNNTKNPVSELFNRWAGTQRGENMAVGHDELVQHVFDAWQLTPEDALLDVGCGNGRALRFAGVQGVTHLAGIDVSPNMVRHAKQNVPRADVRVGIMENLPWEGHAFTHVLSVEAMYYLDNPLEGFKEIRRVLKPEGKVAIVIEYYMENEGSRVWDEPLSLKLNLCSENEWKACMEAAGFSKITTARIVRKNKIMQRDDFVESPYFPSYDLYMEYIRAGALILSN